jgi:hypothetical protein
MDDISPLRQLTPQVLAADAHLFPPRAAYRFRPITAPSTTYDDPTTGENPKYGASINYYLKAATTEKVALTILDAKGEIARTLTGTGSAGLNRVYWDLRGMPTKEIRLRTSPMYSPNVPLGSEGWRPAPNLQPLSILMPPGSYTVKLSVGGHDFTQPLTVRKDPNTAGTEADIEAQTKVLVQLQQELNAAVDAVNKIEMVRSQLEAQARVLDDAAIKKTRDELLQKLTDIEMNLIDLRHTPTGQDGTRYAARLISKIGYLAGGLASGDFKPTDQQLEVQRLLQERLREQLALVDAAFNKDVAAFNELVRSRNIPNVVVR